MQTEGIYFGTEEEAQIVLDHLRHVENEIGMVFRADLYEAIGLRTAYADMCWGWRDLTMARVEPAGKQWTITFPLIHELVKR